LNPAVEIPAVVTSIPEDATSYRNTSISTGPAEIHTVEHVLATCYGLGIDNLLIDIDANEPPEPASGTYAAYVRAFEQAGTVNQGAPVDVFTVDRAVTLKENGIEIHAVPADDFRVSFTIQYDNPQIGTQYAGFTVSPDVFEKEIAPARTFVMVEDVERLRTMGLIKGGNLGNAIVFTRDGVMNEEALRFRTSVCATRSGSDRRFVLVGSAHSRPRARGALRPRANVRFVQAVEIHQGANAWPSPPGRGHQLIRRSCRTLSIPTVDRIIELEDRKRVVGIKNVTINEPFFIGHFPGHLDHARRAHHRRMAQTGGVMLMNTVDDPKKYRVLHARRQRVSPPRFARRPAAFRAGIENAPAWVCTMQIFVHVDGS
jgi:UDP-3-O-[3-hydroxymyristoyl] N-acetylglucosamine deacetylase/3-hydroxyacyl-[acyl-carrier-protein] dehydratase